MMSPEQLAKIGSEHAHQKAVFAWCAMAQFRSIEAADCMKSYEKGFPINSFAMKPVHELRWYHAIPNGGSRGDTAGSRAIRGNQLKAEGVKAGVSDTFLPVGRNGFSGLYIEMKKPGRIKNIGPEQVEFGKFVTDQGFYFVVCDCWKSAVHELKSYLGS